MILVLNIVVLAFIANVYGGHCEDDMVTLEADSLPAVWNVGTVPHLFINSKHLRVGAAVRDLKIIGLDTVTTSLQFCPVDMTIYGNLTVGHLEFIGSYRSNADYLHDGSETFAHGDGEFDLKWTHLQMKNIVAPLRYSQATKKLQIEEMQYQLTEDLEKQMITGLQTDGEGSHVVENGEFAKIDQSSSFPSCVEFIRALANLRSPRELLWKVGKQIFESALAL